jgi:hypothetical protein
MYIKKVYISSCGENQSFYGEELKKLAKLSKTYLTEFINDPEDAEIILVVDIDNKDLFENLRRNPIWRKYPNKSFGIYEGDCAPVFLHGLYSDARKSPFNFNRFVGLDYHMHQICYPNLIPDHKNIYSHDKDILYSFSGRMSHKLRKKLLTHPYPENEVKIIDTSLYNHFSNEDSNRYKFQKSYWDLVLRSKYVLCPKGAAASSVRLFEMMEAGIAPVIISDDWTPPYGLNWKDFAIIVPEKDIANLFCIIKSHENEWLERGQKARSAWEENFASQKYWEFCMSSIDYIKSHQTLSESIIVKLYTLLYFKTNCDRLLMYLAMHLKKRISLLVSLK